MSIYRQVYFHIGVDIIVKKGKYISIYHHGIFKTKQNRDYPLPADSLPADCNHSFIYFPSSETGDHLDLDFEMNFSHVVQENSLNLSVLNHSLLSNVSCTLEDISDKAADSLASNQPMN